jgi:hypothetical protein
VPARIVFVVLVACLSAAPTALAAGPSALVPNPHHVNLSASNCCASTAVVFTNKSSGVVYLKDNSLTGDGWSLDYGNFSCFPYTPMYPNDSCTAGLQFGPVYGPGHYPGTFTLVYSYDQNISTADGNATVGLSGRGTR